MWSFRMATALSVALTIATLMFRGLPVWPPVSVSDTWQIVGVVLTLILALVGFVTWLIRYVRRRSKAPPNEGAASSPAAPIGQQPHVVVTHDYVKWKGRPGDGTEPFRAEGPLCPRDQTQLMFAPVEGHPEETASSVRYALEATVPATDDRIVGFTTGVLCCLNEKCKFQTDLGTSPRRIGDSRAGAQAKLEAEWRNQHA